MGKKQEKEEKDLEGFQKNKKKEEEEEERRNKYRRKTTTRTRTIKKEDKGLFILFLLLCFNFLYV
jgi:hypothetical protein